MPDWQYILLIAGMGLVTFVPRWIPLVALAGRRMPSWLVEWLDVIPVAILAALLAPLLLVSETREIALFKPELLVAVLTFFFAFKTRSLSGTVVVGMLLYWIFTALI